eukprot:gene13092-3624_t
MYGAGSSDGRVHPTQTQQLPGGMYPELQLKYSLMKPMQQQKHPLPTSTPNRNSPTNLIPNRPSPTNHTLSRPSTYQQTQQLPASMSPELQLQFSLMKPMQQQQTLIALSVYQLQQEQEQQQLMDTREVGHTAIAPVTSTQFEALPDGM